MANIQPECKRRKKVSGLVRVLSSKSMLAPRETQVDGAPLIWGLGKDPGHNKKVSTSPRAASHQLSILFPLTRGKQKEERDLRKENQDTRGKYKYI